MDPSPCLQMVIDHIGDGDFKEARHSLRSLSGWINHGGFMPTFPGHGSPLLTEEYMYIYQTLDLVISAGERSVDKARKRG